MSQRTSTEGVRVLLTGGLAKLMIAGLVVAACLAIALFFFTTDGNSIDSQGLETEIAAVSSLPPEKRASDLAALIEQSTARGNIGCVLFDVDGDRWASVIRHDGEGWNSWFTEHILDRTDSCEDVLNRAVLRATDLRG